MRAHARRHRKVRRLPNSSNAHDLGLPETTEEALVRAAVYIQQLLEANRSLMERIDGLAEENAKLIGNPTGYAAERISALISDNARLRVDLSNAVAFGRELATRVEDASNEPQASPALDPPDES